VDLDLCSLVYAGLLKFNNNQELAADLAENWQKSADEKEFLFSLKKNLFWSDGVPFNADDVLFTMEAIGDPLYASPLASAFAGVKTERVDDYQVKFILEQPFSPFLENLTVGILPAHLWQEVEPANIKLAVFNLKPLGLGPYQFKSLTKDEKGSIKSYTLERNKNYHLSKPWIDKIIFKFYPDSDTAIAALKNKNIDGLSYMIKDKKKEFNNRE